PPGQCAARRTAVAPRGGPPRRPDPREHRSPGVALWSAPGGRDARPDDRPGGHRLWAVTPCGADPRSGRVVARAPDAPGIGPNPTFRSERLSDPVNRRAAWWRLPRMGPDVTAEQSRSSATASVGGIVARGLRGRTAAPGPVMLNRGPIRGQGP